MPIVEANAWQILLLPMLAKLPQDSCQSLQKSKMQIEHWIFDLHKMVRRVLIAQSLTRRAKADFLSSLSCQGAGRSKAKPQREAPSFTSFPSVQEITPYAERRSPRRRGPWNTHEGMRSTFHEHRISQCDSKIASPRA